MPTEYTLLDLAKLADVTPRTIRFYIAQGLLPAPTTAGPAARYAESHLARLRLIKRLQQTHLPLADIRQRLRALTDEQIELIANSIQAEPASGSALDYIRGVLGGRPGQAVAERSQAVYALVAAPAAAPAPVPASTSASPRPHIAPGPPPPPVASAPNPEPDRSQWERISLDPDVELHIRRPLTRQQNKRVERLITIARQLLEED